MSGTFWEWNKDIECFRGGRKVTSQQHGWEKMSEESSVTANGRHPQSVNLVTQ